MGEQTKTMVLLPFIGISIELMIQYEVKCMFQRFQPRRITALEIFLARLGIGIVIIIDI